MNNDKEKTLEEVKNFYEQYPDEDIELSEEQNKRIDETYEKVSEFIAFLTNKKKEDFEEEDRWKVSLLVDKIAETLTMLGEIVFLPTVTEYEDGSRTISDTY